MLSQLYLCTREGDHPGKGGREIIPQARLGTAPGPQMAVLMLEPFPSLYPFRRRGWRQGCAGQAGCQAVPPASILLFLLLLFLFLASQGWWELWPLSSSAGRCSLQEKLGVSTVLSKTLRFKVDLEQLLFFFSQNTHPRAPGARVCGGTEDLTPPLRGQELGEAGSSLPKACEEGS